MVNGKTPQSQFSSLSGAQTGATPTNYGRPLATMPDNQNGAAQSNALQLASINQGYQLGQVNPWMAGLSSTLNLGSILGQAGYRPLAGKT